MLVTIEYTPTHENMEYVIELQIDVVQRLSMQDSLHLIVDREPDVVTRDEEDVFEIRADNNLIFSKQTLGRLPIGEEIVDYIINNS